MASNESNEDLALDLLYPFYLDVDMSMAYTAALVGGVTLEEEQVDRGTTASSRSRNLRGALKAVRSVELEAAGARQSSEEGSRELRAIRKHTEASVFIDLYNELRARSRIGGDLDPEVVQVGDLIETRVGPAVLPLRRVVEQLLRLLEIAHGAEPDSTPPVSRQVRRQAARDRAREAAPDDDLTGLRDLLRRLLEDLDRSGMVDVAVDRENDVSVVLTLDKSFVGPTTVEMLHTTSFRVIGKVTSIARTSDDLFNLYRRSSISLVPALSQAAGWGMLLALVGLAEAAGGADLAAQAREQLGLPPEEADDGDEDVRVGEDVAAINPAVSGPAVQILPLAICS